MTALRAAPLAELCELDRRSVRPGDPLADELPFVGVENVTRDTGFLNFDANSRVGSGKSVSFRFDERHVLYGKLAPYLNKVATPDFAGRCSTELVPLLPRGGVDRDFLAHMLRRRETVEFAVASANGTRMPRVDMKLLMAMPIPFPPFDAQRRIAGVLNRAARIVRLREKANDRIRLFAPALFVKTFGDPVENPMGWETGKVGDAATSMEGGFACAKSRLVDDGLLHLRPFNIGRNAELDMTKTYLAPHGVAPRSKRTLRRGDVLFNNTNSRELVGKAALVREDLEAGFSNHVTRVRLDPSVCDPAFAVCHLLTLWLKGYYRDRCTQWIGQAAFGPRMLARTPILLPPLEEQRRFAALADRAARMAAAGAGARSAALSLTRALAARPIGESPQAPVHRVGTGASPV